MSKQLNNMAYALATRTADGMRSRLPGLMAATFMTVVLALLVIVPATRAPTPS